jgi:hypothetical protein
MQKMSVYQAIPTFLLVIAFNIGVLGLAVYVCARIVKAVFAE